MVINLLNKETISNAELLTKEKKSKKNIIRGVLIFAFLGVVLFFITFPFILNKIITEKYYLNFKLKSDLSKDDWFAFLGSYAGAVGTILFGLVAFCQTYMIHRQEEKLSEQQRKISELQDKITIYQVGPVIYVDKVKLSCLFDKRNPMTSRLNMQKYYFAAYGKENQSGSTDFVVMKLNLRNMSVIPAILCEIDKVEWVIATKVYQIILSKEKRMIHYADKIFIVIEDTDEIDIIAPDNSLNHSFFQDLYTHLEYGNIGLKPYDRSELCIQMTFHNVLGEKRKCAVRARIDTTEKKINIGRPYSAEAKYYE